MDSALDRAIRLSGGQTALAAGLEPPARPQAIQQWRRIPADRVIQVARLTRYELTPHDLRPDLYPHPDDGLPVELRGRAAA
ncbi:MAG: helix-turn-helix domain-containing protein [Phycisphaerales bacterium]|nr:helix-turn-helix domain-containing protein [Phycisphaerales bacterium]